MYRIKVGDQCYVCSEPPVAHGEMSAEAVLAAHAAEGEAVSGFYWDATEQRQTQGSSFVWGLGGIDELIADQRDLSACCALSGSVIEKLKSQGALADPTKFAKAIAQVARDPSARLAYCAELSGVVARKRSGPAKFLPVTDEIISVIVPLTNSAALLDEAIKNICDQTCQSRLEIILISCGVNAETHQALKDKVADPRGGQIRLRSFSMSGAPSLPYLVDVGVALAIGAIAVVVDPRCRFTKRTTLQRLADWAAGGDVLTVCPAIEVNDRQRLYGLSATTARRPHLAPFIDGPISLDVRLTAAPTPWTFALNRSAWLGRGGVRGGDGGSLWTSPLAYKMQGAGRNIVLIDEVVTLTDSALEPAQQSTPLIAELSIQAAKAIRIPVAFEQAVEPKTRLVRRRLPNIEPNSPEPPPMGFPLARLESGDGVGDVPSANSRLRLLVFADMFAASQAILFEEGLKQARRRREVTVRIIEDQPGTPEGLDALVQRHMDETRANIVILSRLGSMPLIEAASRAARTKGAVLMAHIDDDLLDLPVSAGIERYRKARNPRRIQALLGGLSRADAVLVSTPELANRLTPLTGPKLKVLRFGVAGAPPRRSRVVGGGALVIGYMGSASHDADLVMIVPALNAVRRDHPDIRLELLGSIAEQPSVALLDPPVVKRGAMIRNYREFKTTLATLEWDVGLAPLRPSAFNTVKTPAKWVEYVEAGIVPIVSHLEPYRPIIEAGAAFSADPDEWETVLRRILAYPAILSSVQSNADRLLIDQFSWDRLEGELLDIFTGATAEGLAA